MMAERNVYQVVDSEIKIFPIEFEWFPGFSEKQKTRSINSLHKQIINELGVEFLNILEISSKSENELGVNLSAFNLSTFTLNEGKKYTVESAFQSSKIFKNGGPYTDLIYGKSIDAKKDDRIKQSGSLVGFKFFSYEFPLNPQTYFYDWLYINVLLKNPELAKKVMAYKVFTDIEFNHKKSINSQAYSAALFVAMNNAGVDMKNFKNPDVFLNEANAFYKTRSLF